MGREVPKPLWQADCPLWSFAEAARAFAKSLGTKVASINEATGEFCTTEGVRYRLRCVRGVWRVEQ